MAGSVNKVLLIGNVGKDPEVRTSQSGARFANFTLATSESWKDKATGERRENTQWHRVTIFNDALVNIAEKYVRKGSKLFIEGQLETRKWTDADGKDQYSTEVVLRPYRGELTLLDSRNNSEGGSSYQSANDTSHAYAPATAAATGTTGGSFSGDIDDDIPF
jgi:single-strand DNA-binding protein